MVKSRETKDRSLRAMKNLRKRRNGYVRKRDEENDYETFVLETEV